MIVRSADREFVASGVDVSVEPLATGSPTVTYLTRVIGEEGAGSVFVPVPASPSLLRLSINGVGTFVTVAIFALFVLAFVPVLLGRTPVLVGSGSMEPALRAGDLVIVQDPSPSLGPGTVITFRQGADNVIHRIVRTTDTGYVTKGDANQDDDSGVVSQTDVTGVGVMLVPYLGLPKLWFEQGRWFSLGVLVVTLAGSMWVTPLSWLARGRTSTRSGEQWR